MKTVDEFFKKVFVVGDVSIDCTVYPALVNTVEFIMKLCDCNYNEALEKWKLFKPVGDLSKFLTFFKLIDLYAFLRVQGNESTTAESMFFKDFQLTEVFRLSRPDNSFKNDEAMLQFVTKVCSNKKLHQQTLTMEGPPPCCTKTKLGTQAKTSNINTGHRTTNEQDWCIIFGCLKRRFLDRDYCNDHDRFHLIHHIIPYTIHTLAKRILEN